MNNIADGRKPYGRGRGNWTLKQCTHCGKHEHTVETCYMKHGFPIGYKKEFKLIVNLASEGRENKSKMESNLNQVFPKRSINS